MIIDSHCHIVLEEMTAATVPADWRPRIHREDGRYLLDFRGRRMNSVIAEFTDVPAMLAEAAATGVDHLLLSPWINLVPVSAGPRDARLVCDVQNGALAAAAAAHPGKVTAVGAVPLQDPQQAARDLGALMAVPGLAGVEVPSNVEGRFLGDDFFLPFWEAAAGTGALVFIHPASHGLGLSALREYYLWNSVGNPVETAVVAAHIALAGVLERLPGLRVLLAHGGGALPIVRGRLRRAAGIRAEAGARLTDGPDASLRRFYYDTVTHDQDLLAGLVGYAGAGHVVLGTDRPFDMGTYHPVEEVRALGLGAEEEDLVLGGNLARLLGAVSA